MMRAQRKSGLVIVLIAISMLGLSAAYAQDDDSGVPATVAPDIVFVRDAPGTSSDQIDEFPRGMPVTVHGRENLAGNGGMWVLVTPTSGGTTGWVLVDLLTFDPSFVLNSLPIIDPAASTVTTSSAATTPDEDVDEAETEEEEEASGVGTTVVVGDGEGLPGQTNQLANLRSGPELTFEIIEQLQANTDATFLGRNANSVWLYVVVEDQAGWFFSGLVDVDGDINALPVLNPDGTHADSGEAVVTTVTTEDGETVAPTSSDVIPDISLRVRPGTPADAPDGRLNGPAEDLGPVLVYCVTGEGFTNAGNYGGGGIAVYRFRGENPGIVLFVPDDTINAARTGPRPEGPLASGSGYNIYYVEGLTLQMTGTDSDGDSFIFEWVGCNQGGRID